MHEIGVCEGLVDAVEKRAGGRPVACVRFRAGALHRIDSAALVQAFELISAGTVAEGAELELVTVPVTARCRSCEAVTTAEDDMSGSMVLDCGMCGAISLDLVSGDELVLESIQIAAPV
jgi:hydrogenase nickel incorporation protein HypA/HybF